MSGGAQGRILAGHQGLGPHAFALEPGRQQRPVGDTHDGLLRARKVSNNMFDPTHYGSARGDTPGKRGMPRIGQMDEIIPET